MDFLHADFVGGTDRTAIVEISREANVLLVDDGGFNDYRSGRPFQYCGGWATRSLVRLRPPHWGHWHVIVDLGGVSDRLAASVRIVGARQRALF